MGKYDKFYDAEKYIIDLFKKEMIGPIASEEVMHDAPLNSYVAGILWPQRKHPYNNYNKLEEQDEDSIKIGDDIILEEDTSEEIKNISNKRPSTFGITVLVSSNEKSLSLIFNYGTYISKIIEKSNKNGEKYNYIEYKRIPHSIKLMIDVSNDMVVYKPQSDYENSEYIEIIGTRRLIYPNGDKLITFTVTNKQKSLIKEEEMNLKSLFQCELKISSNLDSGFLPLQNKDKVYLDIEDQILDMQYRNKIHFAEGHGCAVKAIENDGVCANIESDFIPVAEVKQMKTPNISGIDVFKIKTLYEGNRAQIVAELKKYLASYREWYKNQRQICEDESLLIYKEASIACLNNINICINRIEQGIEILEDNNLAWKAFKYANMAMYKQRESMAYINEIAKDKAELYSNGFSPTWYPFQLFYLIMIIPDFVINSEYRNTVDLLWFPTGGGKTEAYLGVTAFVIFYERLSDKRNHYGTTVLMRYTLRLITIQQFERAAALICACESIRKSEKLGANEISIGLWIGDASSPNKIEEAKESITRLMNGETVSESNPMQLSKCPYCGRKLDITDYSIEDNRMEIKCEKCGHLPVYIVDSDIYDVKPTLVIGTIDKFARVIWNENTSNLFGCNCNVNKPKLIIQDELHLISGPLGTISGLFESAVDRLCWDKDSKPKIIASTATIKNSDDQIKRLYDRKSLIFPPRGINYNDSFFAIEADKNERPSRLYVGLTEFDGSMTDSFIRSFSILCLSDFLLSNMKDVDDEVVDQYYTIIGYFNALRDLGTSSTVIKDRLFNRIKDLLNHKFKTESSKYLVGEPIVRETQDDAETSENKVFYKYNCSLKHGELTSRVKSGVVKQILSKLDNKFQRENCDAYKYVLSSNMISVGIDINRLGLMVVSGQPKSTAEYIQVTSRVGRTNPGIVFTLYNAYRSRDLSYYENFYQYHDCFYKFVEPTSVTPFSYRSIEKGLHCVYIALVRHLIPGMHDNEDARNFDPDDPQVIEIKDYILERVKHIQPDSYEKSKLYLEDFIDYWYESTNDNFVYHRMTNKDCLLISAEENESDFSALNSMRNVESSAIVYIEG